VGCAAHPWRAGSTRLRDLRTYRVTLSAPPEAHSGRSKASQWLAFLNNHREVITAFDFFTVPTLWFRTLYCLFAIEHDRRRILHFNVTFHPTSDWIVQQLREAFPLPCPSRYVLFDHDANFGNDVFKFLRSSHLKPLRTSSGSRGQNGTAERWIGSVRRELLDQAIPLNEYRLRRLGRADVPTIMPTELILH
jgi:putative transposase